MMNKAGQKRQDALYKFIVSYKIDNGGASPTVREMARALETSTSVICYHLIRLDKIGRIRLVHGSGQAMRRIAIPGETWEYVKEVSDEEMPKREERGSQIFILTREQVASAFSIQREVFETRGYHTWEYWRSTTEGEVAIGVALQNILDEVNERLFEELYDAA